MEAYSSKMLPHEQKRTNNILQLIFFLPFPNDSRELNISYGKPIDAAQMPIFLAYSNTISILSPPLLSHHTKATKEGSERAISYFLEDKENTDISKRKNNFQTIDHA